MRRLSLILLVPKIIACTKPPEAPQGLDESSSYMVRNFWSDDATFEAGIQGFYNWFEVGDPENGVPPGAELLGLIPGQEDKPTDAFTVADLTDEDLAIYPLEEEIIMDPKSPNDESDDEMGARDVSATAGVVSLAEMDCSWREAQELLLRADQDAVFPDDWEGYERTYVTPLEDFVAGAESGEFTALEEPIDPYADGFDFDAYGDTLMFTDNMADATGVLGVNLPSSPFELEMRQGSFDIEVGGEQRVINGFAIVTYAPEALWGPDGTNGLRQSYSIEINLERPDDKTLRMLAVWAEPVSPIIGADSPMALGYAVDKSLKSSNRLSAVCSGDERIEDAE